MWADEGDDAEKEAARASGDGEVVDKGAKAAKAEPEEVEASGGNRLLEVELALSAEEEAEAEADRPGGRGRRRDLLSTFEVQTALPRRSLVERAS